MTGKCRHLIRSILMSKLALRQSLRCLSVRNTATIPACGSVRWISSAEAEALESQPEPVAAASPSSSNEPLTHYRITLRRSAIALDARMKGTLLSLGIHRRMQTVYHPHSPEFAGKILRLKELVEVANVPASAVRTKNEQKQERKAIRGYQVVGKLDGQRW